MLTDISCRKSLPQLPQCISLDSSVPKELMVMMKARRSASNCGVPERENGREAVASQLSGLPHARPRAPAGGTEAGPHLQDGAHGVGRGPTQQGAELVEGFQVGLCRAWGSISLGRETRGGPARLPPHISFLPSPAPFMVNPNIIPMD